eukprot:359108-Chlamydomonas_euryale.AAC.9
MALCTVLSHLIPTPPHEPGGVLPSVVVPFPIREERLCAVTHFGGMAVGCSTEQDGEGADRQPWPRVAALLLLAFELASAPHPLFLPHFRCSCADKACPWHQHGYCKTRTGGESVRPPKGSADLQAEIMGGPVHNTTRDTLPCLAPALVLVATNRRATVSRATWLLSCSTGHATYTAAALSRSRASLVSCDRQSQLCPNQTHPLKRAAKRQSDDKNNGVLLAVALPF